LLSVGGSHGFQYGSLRDFEHEVVRLTGATTVAAPEWSAPAAVRSRLAHGTRYSPLRRFVPFQRGFEIEADVLWFIVMGPESSSLDLFRAWDAKVGYRILYLFDTFAEQLPALRRLLSAARWDLAVTAFPDAVPMLERETGRAWVAVPQGVRLDRFTPIAGAKRGIAFSAYGRRVGAVHAALEQWSDEANEYYDATFAASIQREISTAFLYKQYAWHLRQSWFTLSWPVELTNPSRAGSLSPITCRWFEAAAAATTIVGRPPGDPTFESLFGRDAVVPLDPSPRTPAEAVEALSALWARREEHLASAEARRNERMHQWSWEARVREIMALAKVPA
jgi:hypothetical protein